MFKAPLKNLIYLSLNHELPDYLHAIKGVKWNFFSDLTSLERHLHNQRREVFLIVHTAFMNLKAVEFFTTFQKSQSDLTLIFIAQSIDKAAYQLSFANSKILFLYESEGPRLKDLVTRCIHRSPVKSRKHERLPVKTMVMLKKSILADTSPVGGLVQFLKDGQMYDFSQGGALVALKESSVNEKDFISLMYQNRHGLWVSVESQVRWVVSTTRGEQIIGVQFLAVSA